jgi:hypothetical protein
MACFKPKHEDILFPLHINLSGNVNSFCDSTPIDNSTICLTFHCQIRSNFDNSLYDETKSYYFNPTDKNGFFSFQKDTILVNCVSISNPVINIQKQYFLDHLVLNNTNEQNIHFYAFTESKVAIFYNCSNLLVDSSLVGWWSSGTPLQPIYLHPSSIRDSSLSNRIDVIFFTFPIGNHDSLFSVRPIKLKTWYTYEAKKKIGSNITFVKDSFYTGCQLTNKIYF